MAPLQIRRAKDSETEEVELLVRQALDEYRAADADLHRAYLAYSLDGAHAPGADQLVAELDGRLVGSVVFRARVSRRAGWPHTASTFQTLAVDPAMRRHGIGARLVADCIDRAKASGATGIVIETMPWLTAAERFYGPLGFKRWAAGDWDATPLVREILGSDTAPPTSVSAWRLDFPRASLRRATAARED